MSYNLSVNELRDFIKLYIKKPKDETDDIVAKLLLYQLYIMNIIFYGDTFVEDTKKRLNMEKLKLQKIYDDIISSDKSNNYNLPNPRDMVYFATGNNKEIITVYDNINNALNTIFDSLKSDKINQDSKVIKNEAPIYDDTQRMYYIQNNII